MAGSWGRGLQELLQEVGGGVSALLGTQVAHRTSGSFSELWKPVLLLLRGASPVAQSPGCPPTTAMPGSVPAVASGHRSLFPVCPSRWGTFAKPAAL